MGEIAAFFIYSHLPPLTPSLKNVTILPYAHLLLCRKIPYNNRAYNSNHRAHINFRTENPLYRQAPRGYILQKGQLCILLPARDIHTCKYHIITDNLPFFQALSPEHVRGRCCKNENILEDYCFFDTK